MKNAKSRKKKILNLPIEAKTSVRVVFDVVSSDQKVNADLHLKKIRELCKAVCP